MNITYFLHDAEIMLTEGSCSILLLGALFIGCRSNVREF